MTWNDIYSDSKKKYGYYDLNKPHDDLALVIKFLKEKKASKILDLGCGIGRNMIPLIENGFEVIGVDDSKEAIKILKFKLKVGSLKAELKNLKFQNLYFPDNYFDAVISVQTLNHGYEKDIIEGFDEMFRVLKPGGIVFITLPGRISKGKVRYCLVKTARKVEKNTYIPTIGEEVGVPHQIFNKSLIAKYMKKYNLVKKIWTDEKDYYCLLAEKIGR